MKGKDYQRVAINFRISMTIKMGNGKKQFFEDYTYYLIISQIK